MSDSIPRDLRYCSTHEWARLEDDGTVSIGITEHAQDLLGDVVFVDLPTVEAQIRNGEECGAIESVKAASDIYAPISGEVVEVNEALVDMPGAVNSDPYGDGWLFRIKPVDEKELESLLTAAEYRDQISAEEH